MKLSLLFSKTSFGWLASLKEFISKCFKGKIAATAATNALWSRDWMKEQGQYEGAMFHIFNQFLLHFYTLSRHSSVIGIHNVLAQLLFENTEKG